VDGEPDDNGGDTFHDAQMFLYYKKKLKDTGY
jgi:hypothetical protein